MADTNTNSVAAANADATGSATNVTDLGKITVIGQLDQARNQIVPNLGATSYAISQAQIASASQGDNAPFNQVLLRAPGTAQDGLGQLHLRGEHANLQYRINDVLLPEGITGFGQELDTRFVDSLQLITGSLPAQYGFRTAGVVDIQTKNGAFANGGTAEIYGGSYDTVIPSFAYGGSDGKLNYFVSGSFDHNGIGIENPTDSKTPIHDDMNQGKGFAYLSYILDDTSRVTAMLSGSYGDFELPNTPGLQNDPDNHSAPGGDPWLPGTFDSTKVNDTQNEQNYYGVVAYQKSAGKLDLQVAGYGRNSSVHFMPDEIGDLYFNGVASDVSHTIYTGGLQADASYELTDSHTLRAGTMVMLSSANADSTTTVFDLDGAGNPIGAPYPITQNNDIYGQFFGVYLQDEWKIFEHLTLNFGARFDAVTGYVNENQVSPRANLIWQPLDSTTLHIGYARYFTPPPLELVSSGDIAQFNGTSNGSDVTQNDLVKSERANYFDVGITQKLLPGLQVGLDGYYKEAKNQLDDGLFGQSLILSPFNYRKGQIYGAEFTATYTKGGFSTYANVAYSVAQGTGITSAQFLFDSDDLNYINHNWVYMDHDQRITGSFGVAYLWKESFGNTRAYADALYGSGLRTDATDGLGDTIPNGGTVPASYSVNLGIEQSFKIHNNQVLKARLDVVNVTDNVYELRDGGGIGVNAAQYGMRRGFFGSISYQF